MMPSVPSSNHKGFASASAMLPFHLALWYTVWQPSLGNFQIEWYFTFVKNDDHVNTSTVLKHDFPFKHLETKIAATFESLENLT